MSRKSSGVVHVPIGAYAPTYSPGSKRRRHEAQLAEMARTVASGAEVKDAFLRKQAEAWGVAPEDVDLWISNPAGYSDLLEQREKDKDDAARAAVEGGAA